MLNPVNGAARFTDAVPSLAGQFVKDADPALIDALRASGRLVEVEAVRALVPALLALRHSAHLLGEADVVRAHVGDQGRDAARERDDQLASRSTSSTAASATGSRTTSTGRCPATGSGARRSPCGGAATAATTPASDRSRSSPSSPASRSRTSTCTARTSTTSSSTAPSARPAARGGSSRCSTRGSTPARCRPRRCTTRSRTRTRSRRRFPADFICEAIDQTRGWFYSLLAVNTLVFDQAPYKNVVCLALLLDQRRPEDVQEPRQRHGPVERAPGPRRRCAALELRVGQLTVDAQAGVAREHRRDDEPLPAHAVEHVLVLRDLREPRRLDADRRARVRRRPTTCSTGGSDRGCTHGVGGRRRARAVRRPARRAVARAARRRPLQLVRAPLALAVLERGGHRRARGAARVPARHRADARAVLPVHLRRALTRTSRRRRSPCTSATGRSFDAAAIDPALESDMALARQVVSLGLAARTEVRLKVRQPLARALVLLPGGQAIPDVGAGGDRRRAEREAARDGDEPRRPARLLRRPELPPARPEGRASSCRRSRSALADGRRRGDPATRSTPTAASTSTSTAMTIRLEPEDVDVRATSHEEFALAEDAGIAVALDTRLDDDAPARGLRPRGDPGAQRPPQGQGPRDLRPDRRPAAGRRPRWATRWRATATGSPARCSRSSCAWSRSSPGNAAGLRGGRRSGEATIGVRIGKA